MLFIMFIKYQINSFIRNTTRHGPWSAEKYKCSSVYCINILTSVYYMF